MIRIFSSKAQKIGEEGENQALIFLKKEGFSIIERNVANKFGEIDIVAKKKDQYYFFEVKTGKQGSFINPAENLTEAKLRKFIISVEYYCFTCNIKNYTVQGIIVIKSPNNTYSIEMIELF